MASSASPLGFGLVATLCATSLPYPQPGGASPTNRTITAVQPSLGLGYTTTNVAVPSTASGRALLLADVIRRISTPRGSLPDTKVPPTLGRYGIELLDYVNADMVPADVAQFAATVDGQIKQDERIVNSRTTAAFAGNVLVVTINLVDGAGPFKLILAINTLNNSLQVLS